MQRCFPLLAALTKRSSTQRLKSKAAATAAIATTRKSAKNNKQPDADEEENNITTATKGKSLATTFPTYASLWVRATSNKLIQPQHIPYNSKKLVLWRCPSCEHQFKQRVYLYVAAGGRCPSCGVKPSLDGSNNNSSKIKSKNGGGVLSAKQKKQQQQEKGAQQEEDSTVNNKEAKSIADSNYLVVNEKRNLQPMLAKNFEKEMNKIDLDHETLMVSPKLDGIRCIVGYDKKQKAILFFSRAGTLFECCDAKIEPALRYVFEHIDPNLVLDGELYNSSENIRRMEAYYTSTSAGATIKKKNQKEDQTSAFASYYQQLFEMRQKETSNNKSSKAISNANSKDNNNNNVIYFESLVSAIRTTREKRTEEVEQLQQLLQYHMFDVLYASHFPSCNGANVLFSKRYAFLQEIMGKVQAHNKKTITNYDVDVLQVVPSVPLTASNSNNNKTANEVLSVEDVTKQMETNIRVAMSFGYEGIMIRREDNTNNNKKNNKVANAKKSIARANKNNKKKTAFGGYEHGKRSSCLLKYKKMQDAEFVIVSAIEGKGKLKGSLGAFVCEVPNASATSKNISNRRNKNHTESKLFYVTPATSEENKKKMWQQRKTYNGKALTVQYQDLSKEGIPRFPIGKCIRGAADGKDWL